MDNEQTLPSSCNGIVITVQGKKGAPKRIFNIEFDEMLEIPDMDTIADKIAEDPKAEAILETLGCEGKKTSRGIVYEVDARARFSPNDAIYGIELTILFPLNEQPQSNPQMIFMEYMMEQQKVMHHNAMQVLDKISGAATTAIAEIAKSHSIGSQKTNESHANALAVFSSSNANAMAQISATVGGMQKNIAEITTANTQMVQSVFKRMDSLDDENYKLRRELGDEKGNSKSSELWVDAFKAVMPAIVPKALDVIGNLHNLMKS